MKNQINEIKGFRGEHAFLSNFYCGKPFKYNGLTFSNTEAAFQAQKCLDDTEKQLFSTFTPLEAKRKGLKVKLRDNWNDYRYFAMYCACKAKFNQDPSLKKKLLDTGTAHLIEGNTWHDNEWGACTCPKCENKKGKNFLGHTLMQIRYELSLRTVITDISYMELLTYIESLSNTTIDDCKLDNNRYFISWNIDDKGKSYYIGVKTECRNEKIQISVVTHRKRFPIVKWLNGDSLSNVYSKDISNYLKFIKNNDAAEANRTNKEGNPEYIQTDTIEDSYVLEEFAHDNYFHSEKKIGKNLELNIISIQYMKDNIAAIALD